MIKDIICTIGPVSLNKEVLTGLKEGGMTIARINGSHGTIDEIKDMINKIREVLPEIPVLLDLPGNKIRTTNVGLPLVFKENDEITLKSEMLTYPDLYKIVEPGAHLLADDNTLLFEVLDICDTDIVCRCLCSGVLKPNKGIYFNGEYQNIPFVFEKDMRLLDLAVECNLDYVGSSFIRTAENVRRMKAFLDGKDVKLVSKIETIAAVNNLHQIVSESDYVMIDRGDLGSEVGLANVIWYQHVILKLCNKHNIPVIIATQLLKSMENKPLPYISEVSDITNAILNGASALMLSEETAVGNYPIKSVQILKEVASSVEQNIKKNLKIIILSAGESPGFGSLTVNKHKCMIDIGGKTIIEHQIENIRRCGIDEDNIVVITGTQSHQIEKYLGGEFKGCFIYNPWYRTTHIVFSLSFARHLIDDGFIILYGDVVFDSKILHKLIEYDSNNITIVVDKRENLDEEDEKLIIKNGSVRQIGKNLEIEKCNGEFIGLAKIPKNSVHLYLEQQDKIVKNDDFMAPLTDIFNKLIELGIQLDVIYTEDLLWSDNDDLSDLRYTMSEIYPNIN